MFGKFVTDSSHSTGTGSVHEAVISHLFFMTLILVQPPIQGLWHAFDWTFSGTMEQFLPDAHSDTPPVTCIDDTKNESA